MKYFKISWNPADDENVTYREIFEAETLEKALELLNDDIFAKIDGVKNVHTTELSAADYIASQQDKIRNDITIHYIHNHNDIAKLSSSQYAKLWKKINSDDDLYIKAYLEMRAAHRILLDAQRDFDLEKISVDAFQKFLGKAVAASIANDHNELENLKSEMPHKPKKKK